MEARANPGTQARASTVTGETDISPPVTQPLLPPLHHLPVRWLWLTAAPGDEEAVLEGIPPKKSYKGSDKGDFEISG